jgi:hypothetical protein
MIEELVNKTFSQPPIVDHKWKIQKLTFKHLRFKFKIFIIEKAKCLSAKSPIINFRFEIGGIRKGCKK